jgi:hypothetical protein
VAASWSAGELDLTPGQVYYLEVSQSFGFNPYRFTNSVNVYPDGHAFQSGGAQTSVDLHMQVVEYAGASATPPTIARSPAALSPSCAQGTNASGQSFTVQNTGGGTLSYTIIDNASWLSCSPVNGTSIGEPDTINVTYTTSALAVGTHNATITITDAGATNSPQIIAVTLAVTSSSGSERVTNGAFGSAAAWSAWRQQGQIVSDFNSSTGVPAGGAAPAMRFHTSTGGSPFNGGVVQRVLLEGGQTYSLSGRPNGGALPVASGSVEQV